ncbi:hypothetical protein L7F22_022861 [Adiantum nelumboides]|nr:hypothetical protein [Adiantum nelumboides]
MSGKGAREAVFPTRMTLNNTKTRLKGAQTGHSLLKRKADALTKRFRDITSKIDEAKRKMGKVMQVASFSIAEVTYATGDIAYTVQESVKNATFKVQAKQENVSGVLLPAFESIPPEKGGAGGSTLPAVGGEGHESHRLAATVAGGQNYKGAFKNRVGNTSEAEARGKDYVLCPDVTVESFESWVKEVEGIVGKENVLINISSKSEDQAKSSYIDQPAFVDFFPIDDPEKYQASAQISPASVDEVSAVVKACNKYGQPIHAVSLGRNLGIWRLCPSSSWNCNHESETVTYFELYEHLQSLGSNLWIDCPDIGWGSVIGNTTERGADPGGFKPFLVTIEKKDQLHELFERLRPLRNTMTIQNGATVRHVLLDAACIKSKSEWQGGDDSGLLSDERVDEIAKELDLGGPSSILHSRAKTLKGIPNLLELDWVSWAPNGAHCFFSPISPVTGKAATGQYELVKKIAGKYGFDFINTFSLSLQRLRPDSRFFETVFEHSTLISIFRVLSLTSVGLRELHNITCLVYDKTNKEQRDKMRACLTECIDEAAKMGWGEYRTHPAFYDQIAGTYSFNNHALSDLNNTLKDSLDPNGILSPGKYGVWPKRYRGKGL